MNDKPQEKGPADLARFAGTLVITASLLVTPSAFATFSKSRRNRLGKLIVSVSLMCKTLLHMTA